MTCLNNEELKILTKIVTVPESFEEVTMEMSAGKFTSLSRTIPIVWGLQGFMGSTEDMKIQQLYRAFPPDMELQQQISSRFHTMEGSFFVGAPSILDPLFKKIPFADHTDAKRIEERLITRLRGIQESSTSSRNTPPTLSILRFLANSNRKTKEVNMG